MRFLELYKFIAIRGSSVSNYGKTYILLALLVVIDVAGISFTASILLFGILGYILSLDVNPTSLYVQTSSQIKT